MESKLLSVGVRGISKLVVNVAGILLGKMPGKARVKVLKALRMRPLDRLGDRILKQVQDRPDAHKAAHEDSIKHKAGRLVMFTDASVAEDGSSAIAVSWRFGSKPNEWHSKYYSLPTGLGTNLSEFCGIIQALNLAAQLYRSTTTKQMAYDAVIIYTDSQSAITCFHQLADGDVSRVLLFDTQKLDSMVRTLIESKVAIELHWCPGHSGIVGNEISNDVSMAARRQATLEKMSLQPQINSIINRRASRLLANMKLGQIYLQSRPTTNVATIQRTEVVRPLRFKNHPGSSSIEDEPRISISQILKSWLFRRFDG